MHPQSTMLCSAPDCVRFPHARGLCGTHLWRLRHHRTLDQPRRRSDAERFAAWTQLTDGCHLWTGTISENGYGRFTVNRRFVQAHRWAYEQVHGPIPPGLQLDHLCRNRACVNVAHLEAVTGRVNTLRGATRAARNLAKTHCPLGHAYDAVNTYTDRNGGRSCKECKRRQTRAYKQRKRLADLGLTHERSA